MPLAERCQGSGFRVQGSGFRVQGSGFRVQGSGFRGQGSGFRVQGPGSHPVGVVLGELPLEFRLCEELDEAVVPPGQVPVPHLWVQGWGLRVEG